MAINSQPAHSYHGSPVSSQRLAPVAGSYLAAASAPYVGRGDKCSGNDDTCGANRVRGQEYCQGHLKQAASLKQVAEVIESQE
ncbi:hypothetical protein UFOVP582_46 [uncultured Caudovirales phage]|uniref:Uncharacterized protein n=1 Tax=uncultured Caudovirales phage TaxID=2100421 RepID=A0A6J7XC46_9CAUD|nr:hypothetical protein UFOVP582_46 [uncultured Caudovirales phage]CAB4183786.1 hypothetical protein UFOVP1099_8 [uncultured Caudovirales phage]CAB4214067.1 hypothetical protein UFOVP1460_13 [uncultured Caudovirales phage]CAB5228640.1 hypothetical protein UFOVP1548_16 [uncultured Caudovirales phage]